MLYPPIKLKEKQNKNTWEKKKLKNRKSHLLHVDNRWEVQRTFFKAAKPSVQV